MLTNANEALAKANEKDSEMSYATVTPAPQIGEILGMDTWQLSTNPSLDGVQFYISADETLFTMPVIKLDREQFAEKVREYHSKNA